MTDAELDGAKAAIRYFRISVQLKFSFGERPMGEPSQTHFNLYIYSFEIEDASMNPMQEAFAVESIHSAAFANNTVGLPKICPGKHFP